MALRLMALQDYLCAVLCQSLHLSLFNVHLLIINVYNLMDSNKNAEVFLKTLKPCYIKN